jgi:putative tricarboxylic transport membrane protein
MEIMSGKGKIRQGMNRTEQILPLVWIAVAIWVCIGSVNLQLGSFSEPGPGFLPFGAGLFLGIMAIIRLIQGALGQFEEEGDSPWTKVNWKKVVLILISLFIYTFLLPWLGYLIATFLLMLFFFTFLKKMRWWVVLGYSLSVILISYLVFGVWLLVQFPRGILGVG